MADDYLTLTEFIPGTKAKAQEVNANFSALKDAISTKASITGDSTQNFSVKDATLESHATNKGQLDDLSEELVSKINKMTTKFCVKSGHTTNGEGDLFSYDVLRITPKIGGTYGNLVISDYTGLHTTISSASEFSMTGKPDGTYNIFIKPDGALYTLANTIFRQRKRPTMTDGDVWFNTGQEPFSCIKYDGTNDNEFLDVPLGRVTISGGAITSLTTLPFNQNGYDVNIYTFSIKKFDYTSPVSKSAGVTYTAESNGLLFIRHANVNDTITVTIDGYYYVLGWSTSQGSSSSNFIPVTKGQTYSFTGGEVRYFIPEVNA